jgi:putative ABC transport system permease protein
MGTGQDLRYGLRQLARRPGFTVAAILTLALGLGANAIVFSLVDAVLLRPLPYPAPERLVRLWATDTAGEWSRSGTSLLNFSDWWAESRGFERMAAYNEIGGNLAGGSRSENVRAALVTPGFFETFGVRPLLGRGFREEENRPGADDVAVISYGLWQGPLGGDPDVLESAVTLGERRLRVVGVMPRGFEFPGPEVRLWKPFGLSPGDGESRTAHWVLAIGRLAPGTPLEDARREMDSVARRLEERYPEDNAREGILLEPLHDATVASVRPALYVLWAAVGCVLLIACANTAHLLLSRAGARSRELALRSALGAGRLRLVRQLMTEALLLALLGALTGVGLAWVALRAVPLLAALDFEPVRAPSLDARVLAFSGGLALLTALLFGLLPALRAAGKDLRSPLQAGVRAGGAPRARSRAVLIASEIALAVVLTLGAGLLIRSFVGLIEVETGFDARGVTTFRVEPPQRTEPAAEMEDRLRAFVADRERASALYAELVQRLEALPGVRRAAAINRMPLSGFGWATNVYTEGGTRVRTEAPVAAARVVTPGYFSTLGIELLEGRLLDDGDLHGRRPVAVIDRSMANEVWPGEDPLGRRFSYNPDDERFWYTVVGVVENVRNAGLIHPPSPVFYTHFSQSYFGFFGSWGMDVVLRSAGDAAPSLDSIRGALEAVDPGLPAFNVRTMEEALADDVAQRRWMAWLLGAFSGVALALAAVGVYGVIAFAVSRRTREIGVRIAVGATSGDVVWLVLRDGMRPVWAGLTLGLAGAFVLTRYLESMLFEVRATDPATWIGASTLLVLVAVAACLVPARQAVRVNPGIALRSE